MYICLSHMLNTRDRAFPNAPTMKIIKHETIGENSPCNTYRIDLFNHFGTHIDGPNHFNPDGKMLYELPLEMFISNRPLIIDIPKSEGEGIMPEELMPYDEEIAASDMLFIRTGFEEMRYKDNEKYSARGPYFSAAAAKLLVERWSHLKALGLDSISLASPLNLADGTIAHQTMLGISGSNPILIVEDVALSRVSGKEVEEIIVSPLFIEGIDSAPVTVLAKTR